MEPVKKELALFDLDGTLTTRDTALHFARHLKGWIGYWKLMFLLSPILVSYKFGLIGGSRAKAIFFRRIYKGMERNAVLQAARDYWTHNEGKILRTEAIEKLQWHLQNKHQVFIVSASADIWLLPISEMLKTELICTRMEIDGEFITGEIKGTNCNGPEKARRIKSEVNIGEYAEIYAYGDTSGDREMLALASKQFYRKF